MDSSNLTKTGPTPGSDNPTLAIVESGVLPDKTPPKAGGQGGSAEMMESTSASHWGAWKAALVARDVAVSCKALAVTALLTLSCQARSVSGSPDWAAAVALGRNRAITEDAVDMPLSTLIEHAIVQRGLSFGLLLVGPIHIIRASPLLGAPIPRAAAMTHCY